MITYFFNLAKISSTATVQAKIINVALVIGHTMNGDKGAWSKNLETTEYDYWLDVANRALKLNTERVQIHLIDLYQHRIQDYFKRQSALANLINNGAVKYDYVVELHFNAASETANGSEACYWFGSEKGKAAAQSLVSHFSKKFKTTVRADKGARALLNKEYRGYYFVYLIKYVAVIFEPFFGSNAQESEKFRDRDLVAQELLNALSNLK